MSDKVFRLTEQNYRYLFDNASDAMWVHDMDGDILVANKACEKLTGYSSRELVKMNITQFLTTDFLDTAREVRRKLLVGESFEQPYQQQLMRKDGITRFLRMATSLLMITGEARGFQHIARDVTEEKEMTENMRYYVQQITRAQEDERKRIARQLHDELAPPLLLLLQRVDAVVASTRPRFPDSLKPQMGSLRGQAVEALEGLRRAAQDLRPRILDDLGLVPALEWIAEGLVKNYGIETTVTITGRERSLPTEVRTLLFRIAQEALSNVRRHSRATTALISLEFSRDHVRMTVTDNGQGFEVTSNTEALAGSGKLGIIGMYERARLLGGKLSIKSSPGKGAEITAQIPVK